MKKIIFISVFVLTLWSLYATTWYETDVKCPICCETNQLNAIGSYGSYIYRWPEKLQFIFWPVTEGNSIYTCNNCYYSAFMWDFKEMGADTIELIKKNLPNLNLTAHSYSDKMTEKLESAEKIYKLYNSNPEFWCKYYRIKGYHYEREDDFEKAKTERLIALAISDSLRVLKDYSNSQKELYFLSGSMLYFTNQDSLASKLLEIALNFEDHNPSVDSARNKGYNEYLNSIILELQDSVQVNLKK